MWGDGIRSGRPRSASFFNIFVKVWATSFFEMECEEKPEGLAEGGDSPRILMRFQIFSYRFCVETDSSTLGVWEWGAKGKLRPHDCSVIRSGGGASTPILRCYSRIISSTLL